MTSSHFIAQGFSLEGRVALVTGAGSGLGAQFARTLGLAGARVVCAARRVDRVEQVAASIREQGGQAMACSLDVNDPVSINQALLEIHEHFDDVDILVNNAGLSDPAPFTDMSKEQWESLLQTNLSSPFYLTQAVTKALIAKQKPGSIINIASILGHLAYPNFINYGTTKGALIHMTKYMALDLIDHGIRVNAIAPGYFPSEMTDPFYQSDAGKAEIAKLPPKRLGRHEELDGPLLLLASDMSSYMTGSVLTVDCGHSIRLS